MTENTELRVFYNMFELDRNYRDFCNSSICEHVNTRDQTAQAGNWRIKWVWFEQAKSTMSHIAGMTFERIQCDMRVPWEVQRYILTRIRSRNEVHPMISFYDQPWDVKYN